MRWRCRIGGIPPGRYILMAWLNEAICDVYDPAGLDARQQTGDDLAWPRLESTAFRMQDGFER